MGVCLPTPPPGGYNTRPLYVCICATYGKEYVCVLVCE